MTSTNVNFLTSLIAIGCRAMNRLPPGEDRDQANEYVCGLEAYRHRYQFEAGAQECIVSSQKAL